MYEMLHRRDDTHDAQNPRLHELHPKQHHTVAYYNNIEGGN